MTSKVVTIIVLLSFNSCDMEQISFDDIDIKADAKYEIVIDGFLSNEKTIHYIKLSKPTNGYDSIAFLPINNAEVYLTDVNNRYNYILSEEPGVFESEDSIKGEVGNSYTVNVIYNNKLYTATDVMVKCDVTIDFPVSEIQMFEYRVEMSTPEHNFGYNSPSIWSDNETTDSLGINIVHFDINDIYSMRLYNHVGSIPQGIFPTLSAYTGVSGILNDSLEIIKMSVSDSYYKYLVSRFNITNWSSGMFATIPGNTLTNVSSGGTGFFYATEAIRYRLTYKDLAEIYE